MYRVLVGKPEGSRPLRRPRRRWVANIRMDLHEVGCGYMDWIGLAQDREGWRTLVSAVMNLRVPYNVGNFLTTCKPVSFSRMTLHHGVNKYAQIYITTPSLYIKMGTGSFPGVKCGRSVLLTTHPRLVSRSWKSRAKPLPTLWATPGL